MARSTTNIKSKISDSVTFHTNVDQHALIILEDKVRLTLIEYEKQFQNKTDWWNPLSILITILIAIVTTNFVDFFFVPAATIRALAYFAVIYFGYQTIKKIYKARTKKPITIDDVIKQLRESSEEHSKVKNSSES